MLNVLIVEDNQNEMEYCCNAVKGILKDCLLLKAGSGEEALVLMSQERVDVFFIDVELPGISGFRLAEQIRSNVYYKLTSIVFITGYKTNQLSVHKKFHHYEYIAKPYTLENFQESMGPFLKELDHLKNQNDNYPADTKKKVILLEAKDEVILANLDDILFFETQGRGLLLHTKYITYHDIKMGIEDVVQTANCESIARCHKSFAINVNNVKSIKSISRRLWNADFGYGPDHCCQISRTYYSNIYSLFQNLKES